MVRDCTEQESREEELPAQCCYLLPMPGHLDAMQPLWKSGPCPGCPRPPLHSSPGAVLSRLRAALHRGSLGGCLGEEAGPWLPQSAQLLLSGQVAGPLCPYCL